MDNQEFGKLIKKERNEKFAKPYDIVYKSFLDLNFSNLPEQYFLENASAFIENIRKKTWENYQKVESDFSSKIYKGLFDSENLNDDSVQDAVYNYIESNTDHFYTLSLSNTQSRRTRAGSEFEIIIEFLLMGAGIRMDSQGYLAAGMFNSKNLGKSVDLVSPGALEYGIQKRKCSLISCKTTLRERWAEVVEEMKRTGASEIYLATLDDKISSGTIEILNDANIIPVVTEEMKNSIYSNFNNVISYEEMLTSILEKDLYWDRNKYNKQQIIEKTEMIEQQMVKHKLSNHNYACSFYEKTREFFE